MVEAGAFLFTVIAFMISMLQHTTLAAALAGLTVIATAGVIYLLYSGHRRRDERLDEIEQKLDSGFEEALEALNDADETAYPTMADGSGNGWQPVRNIKVQDVDLSPIPSMAGAAAGGALGAPFGPYGAAAGAALGAIIGGGKAYVDLQEDQKTRLDRAAWTAVKKMTKVPNHRLSLVEVEDDTTAGGDYWKYTFLEDSEMPHHVRISKTSGTIEYRPGESQRRNPAKL